MGTSSGGSPAKARDLRRMAMIWMLYQVRRSWKEVGAAFDLSESRAAELGRIYERVIERRMRTPYIEPWAQRLRAAGAI